MICREWAALVAAGCIVLIGGAARLGAQDTTARPTTPPAGATWNDSTTRSLVGRAVARRAQQLADTGLRDYTARASGYLTFLGQLGEGFTEPPRVVKADQLALEVFWQAPDRSKQRIIGRRDTLLLPTDIAYHRDHLGIVQNNFPEIIRLGDGDEVRDVPHPLSRAGQAAYDFAITDSLRIGLPGRVLDVYEVKVRPRDDRLARVIGAVYLERDDAQVVRMQFNFTTAAFLDRNLEDLSIVLENGLVGSRFWLPRRQEIEIQRTGTWLDYPARGIIRGRWEIGEYALNQGLPAERFAGPEIVLAPPAELRRYPWQGMVLDSLPSDVRAASDPDIARVQAEARRLVREQALQRRRGTVLAARGISDLVRVNRVEGLALGVGATGRLGNGFSATARGRYGIDDARAKGALGLGWQRATGVGLRIAGYAEHAEASEVPERSGVANTIAAQEFGSDHTDPFQARGLALSATTGRRLGFDWTFEAAAERQRALVPHADPAVGSYAGTLAFPALDVRRGTVRLSRPTTLVPLGLELRLDAQVRLSRFERVDPGGSVDVPEDVLVPVAAPASTSTVTRASLDASIERPLGRNRLVFRTLAVGADGSRGMPPQELALFGGPTSGPGYDFHSLAGRYGVSQRLELQLPIPAPSLTLGRFGRVPGQARLAPYVHLVVTGGDATVWRRDATGVASIATRTASGVRPAVGVGLLTLFDVIRLDVARGLRDGRWTFSADVAREFWRIL